MGSKTILALLICGNNEIDWRQIRQTAADTTQRYLHVMTLILNGG